MNDGVAELHKVAKAVVGTGVLLNEYIDEIECVTEFVKEVDEVFDDDTVVVYETLMNGVTDTTADRLEEPDTDVNGELVCDIGFDVATGELVADWV